MLEDDSSSDCLAAAADFFAFDSHVWAVFGVASTKICGYPKIRSASLMAS